MSFISINSTGAPSETINATLTPPEGLFDSMMIFHYIEIFPIKHL
ncbi:MAG: hypothetical protein ABRQ39_21055 [Candidatus Eremiobacterota bacterium]